MVPGLAGPGGGAEVPSRAAHGHHAHPRRARRARDAVGRDRCTSPASAARAVVLDTDDRLLLVRFEFAAEGVTRWRSWSVTEPARSDEHLAPRALPRLRSDLIGQGPPGTPVDAGV